MTAAGRRIESDFVPGTGGLLHIWFNLGDAPKNLKKNLDIRPIFLAEFSEFCVNLVYNYLRKKTVTLIGAIVAPNPGAGKPRKMSRLIL